MAITITASCRKHPRYEAKKPPRCECKDCLKLYALRAEFESTSRISTKETVIGDDRFSPRSFAFGLVIPGRIVGTKSMERK